VVDGLELHPAAGAVHDPEPEPGAGAFTFSFEA
jgi:hypothetical protein